MLTLCATNLRLDLERLSLCQECNEATSGFHPVAGTFMLVEIDVSSTVSSEALEPFAKELAARKQRREDRAVQEAARRLQEAEAEAALASSFAAPSAAQLQVHS